VKVLRRRSVAKRYPGLDALKLEAIDFAFEERGCRSFADLGGVWAVDGGYSCYAADLHGAERGVLVDDDLTPELERRAARLPALELVRGNFGAQSTADQVGEVDAIFLFDVLLHQVKPDWDEILSLYAPHARCFVIVQPQWNGDSTVRLLDLGEEEYLRVIPSGGEEIYGGLFERLDEVNERRGRAWRDVHDIWQWGISDDDLVAAAERLGYECVWRRDEGSWRGLDAFHAGAFVFDRG
jgi:hypothetical protein